MLHLVMVNNIQVVAVVVEIILKEETAVLVLF